MEAGLKIAKLLRTSKEVILELDKKMSKISGRQGVLEKMSRENEHKVRQSLIKLGFGSKKNFFEIEAESIYQALVNQVKKNNQLLFEHFHQPDFSSTAGCRSVINGAVELAGELNGFFLKEGKIKELLKLNPPKNIMASLGYGDDIEKLINQEDIFEIFCALRFVEDSSWLNEVFFKPYTDLKRGDFEERKIKVLALPERWRGIGQKFLGKKLHHMSHLKELGIVFVIPVSKRSPGEIIYLFFMTLHYLFEVDWHSRLFRKYSQESNFAKKMIEALKVEVSETALPNHKKASWRVVAKYLAKKDSDDWRLAEPHISPEAWHYNRAAQMIYKFCRRFPDLDLCFWKNLDVVGEYFPSGGSNKESLISFDLFDNGISLLSGAGFDSKYLYHQQEALWNKLFTEYMGEGEMDNYLMDNLDKGFVTFSANYK